MFLTNPSRYLIQEHAFAAGACSNSQDHATIRISHAFITSLVTVRLPAVDRGNSVSNLLSAEMLAGPLIAAIWPSKSSIAQFRAANSRDVSRSASLPMLH